jgi:hypothetical protein
LVSAKALEPSGPTIFPDEVQRSIDGDAVEPSRGLAFESESRSRSADLQEDLLGYILGLLLVVQQIEADRIHERLVALKKIFERFNILPSDPADQIFVRWSENFGPPRSS